MMTTPDPHAFSFSVTCSDVEQKALQFVMVDIQDWLQKTLTARASAAMNEVVKVELDRMVKDPSITTMPANQRDIIMNAVADNCSRPTLKDETDRVPKPAPD